MRRDIEKICGKIRIALSVELRAIHQQRTFVEVTPLAKSKYTTAPPNLTHNRWTIIRYSHAERGPEGRNLHFWICRCRCGTEKAVLLRAVLNGTSRSCGCLNRERITLHGMSGTPAHNSWAGIMRRCVWEPEFEGYSGRGIRVCTRWQAFENFFADLGERPPNKSIDRIDNDDHYSCGKCDECRANGWPLNGRWATPRQQMNNRRTNKKFTWNDRTLSIAQWEQELGITGRALTGRLLRGWTFERAITTPFQTRSTTA